MRWVDNTGGVILEITEEGRTQMESGERTIGNTRIWYWINPGGGGEMIVDLSDIEFDFTDFSGEFEPLDENKIKLIKGVIVVGKRMV